MKIQDVFARVRKLNVPGWRPWWQFLVFALMLPFSGAMAANATFDFGTGADVISGATTQTYANNSETISFATTGGGNLYFAANNSGDSGSILGGTSFSGMSGRIMSANVGDVSPVTKVRISVTGKTFNLTTLNFYDFMEASSTITLTSDKGAITTFAASMGATSNAIDVTSNSNAQGVNWVDVTSSGGNYLPMFDNVVLTNITAPKSNPTLSITNSPATYDGTAKSATVSGSVAGTVSNIKYDSSATVPTAAGTYAITADFAPTDTTNYNSLTGASAGNFVISKATPTASVSNSPATYDGSAKSATVACLGGGTASSILTGGAASQTAAGTYAVTVNCAASANYNSTTGISAGNFVISKATPTASITNTPVTYDGSAKSAAVACLGGGAASNILTGGAASQTAVGTYTVAADCAASTNYNSATSLSAGNFVISQAAQSITFSPGTQTFGTSPTLSASTTATGLSVTFSTTTPGVCTVTSGGVLTFVTAGTCTISADQGGNGTYAAASTVTQSFTINAVAPGTPTIGTATAGDTQASVAFTPGSTGGATVTYTATCTSSDGGTTRSNTGSASPITVTGLTNGKSYTCAVTAGNSGGNSSASSASNSFSPAASQTITFGTVATKNFGTTPTLTATTTAGGLTVAFSSTTPSVCTITSGGALTFLTTGTCSISADQAGGSGYLAAATVTQSFTVSAVAPGAPTGVSASAGDTQASVSFSAPASNGGATIDLYTATCTSSDGGATGTNTGTSSPIVVSGLTDGKTYTCTVAAHNSAGTGSASAASNAVYPQTGPAVTSVTVPSNGTYKTGGNLDFTVNWDGAVTVTGTPRIALVIGATTVYATYQSGSGTTATVFRYTVLSGQSDTDGIAVGALGLNSGTIQNGSGVDATLTLPNVGTVNVLTSVLVDAVAPTLPAANIVVNNQADPHQVVLTFSENLASGSIGSAANWALTANGGSPSYSIASVALSSNKIVTLTLAAVDVTNSATTITDTAANAHLKVTPPSTLTDVAGNTYAAGQVTEAGAAHVLDSTAPTLSSVASSAPSSSGGTLAATASEKVKGYWIAVASGATAPSVAQVKAAANYGAVTVAAAGNGALPSGSAGSLTLSGLAASTAYDLCLVAEDAAGNLSAVVSTASLTTAAAPAASSGSTPTTTPGTTPSTTTLPTGGGTATPSAGQTVVVTNNGNNGSTINLPTPPSSTTGATVTVELPGTGNIAVSNNSSGTQLQVQNITLPGSSTPVSTVSVSNGSATLVASGAGQTLVTTGVSNGLTVTSGASGTSATVTASGNTQSIALTGSANLTLGSSLDTQRTTVTLNQGSNGSTSQANLNIGGQTLSVSTSGGNTQLQVVPTTTANGQSTNAIVVTGGSANIVGQSGQVMNVVPTNVVSTSSGCGSASGGYFEARSNNAQSSVLSVNQGNLALVGHIPQGVVAYHYTSNGCNTFSMATPLDAGTAKEVLIYQGEYVEVDKNGQPVKIVVRSKDGQSGAAGDPLTTAAAANFSVDTVIPRLDLNTGRLPAGQSISQSIENMLKLSTSGWVFSSQDGQGVIRVTNSGNGGKLAVVPVGEVLADAERQDGVQCVGDGLCQAVAGNLITSFNAALDAPEDFVSALRQLDGSASVRLNREGNLVVTIYGRTYLAQVGWNVLPAGSSNGFASSDGGLWFAAKSGKQALYPVLANLSRLLTVLKKIDPSATAQGDHQGTFSVVLNGQNYRLAPEWELIATPSGHAGDDYWIDNGVVYINFLDGTAQGVRVK